MIFQKAAELFENWQEPLILSCLQGYMGTMIVDDEKSPMSAIIDIRDFCFCAGVPDMALLCSLQGSRLLLPQHEGWEQLIEKQFDTKAHKFLRYATKKDPSLFNKDRLMAYISALDSCYKLVPFDQKLFDLSKRECWSQDLCPPFADLATYKSYAAGVAILHEGKLVAGASPYAIYGNGIEIEIDTKPEYRGKGLATACGAKLILDCLSKGQYPNWDAHDLRSLHLAEKLGYQLCHPYTAYELAAE